MASVTLRAISELKNNSETPLPSPKLALAKPRQPDTGVTLQLLSQISQRKAIKSLCSAEAEDLFYFLEMESNIATLWGLVPFLAVQKNDLLLLRQRFTFAQLRNSRNIRLSWLEKGLLDQIAPTVKTISIEKETPRSILTMLNLFRGTKRLRNANTLEALSIADGIWKPMLVLTKDSAGTIFLQPHLIQGTKRVAMPDHIFIIGQNDKALVTPDSVYLLDLTFWGTGELPLLTHHHQIESTEFVQALEILVSLTDHVEISDELRPKKVQGIPVPYLTLTPLSPRTGIIVRVAFGYPPYTNLISHRHNGNSLNTMDNDNSAVFIHRDYPAESSYLSQKRPQNSKKI